MFVSLSVFTNFSPHRTDYVNIPVAALKFTN